MTLEKIFNKIGKQPLHISRHTNAVAIIDGQKYPIEKIVYENGKPIGFKVTYWHDADDYPKEEKILLYIH